MSRRKFPLALVASLSAGLVVGLDLPAPAQDAPPPAQEPEGQPPAGDPPAGDPPAGDPPAGDPGAGPAPGGRPGRPARPGRGEAGDGDEDPMGPKRGRKVDTTSEVARRLAERLHVPPRYCAEDGTVELVYQFREEGELLDWQLEGLDRVEEGANARGNRPNPARAGRGQFLSLGAGSSKTGVALHVLELSGDYEATFEGRVVRSSTRAQLVFLLGKGGASFGTKLVRGSGRGFSALDGAEEDRDPWAGGRTVTVRLSAQSGELVSEVNRAKRGSSNKLAEDLDGRVGILLRDMLLVIQRVTIRGTVNLGKLPKS